ncbi:transposase family protein [Streptomyces sp. NPDC051665]|uniref:helix-turn-helix domain-containing protein n=1 Tax=Streptomyces sp. NPDC051665 TaxID=3154647 RepID=UPI003429E4E1
MVDVVGIRVRAAIMRSRRITGLLPGVIAELVAEIGPLWHERHQAGLASRPRRRAVGAGAKHKLVFVDRLLATLIHLRHGATHDVLACWFGVDRSTITRAIGEMRPLLAMRGCTIAPDVRLRTLAEVMDHLGASGQTGIIDGTEIRVRRPAAGRKDREKFISGKNKQNAVSLTQVSSSAIGGSYGITSRTLNASAATVASTLGCEASAQNYLIVKLWSFGTGIASNLSVDGLRGPPAYPCMTLTATRAHFPHQRQFPNPIRRCPTTRYMRTPRLAHWPYRVAQDRFLPYPGCRLAVVGHVCVELLDAGDDVVHAQRRERLAQVRS